MESPKAKHENFTGYKIKSYHFVRILGEGSFSKVWEAYD